MINFLIVWRISRTTGIVSMKFVENKNRIVETKRRAVEKYLKWNTFLLNTFEKERYVKNV